jgi:glycosyltransferase involved in cell wall biosynthesis
LTGCGEESVRNAAAGGPVVVLLDPAGDRYGASRFTASLAEEIARRGGLAEIWVPFDHGIGELVDHDNVTVRVVPVPVVRRSEWQGPGAVRSAARLARQVTGLVREAWRLRGRVAVVHAVAISSVAGVLVSRIAAAPLHWSVHETVQNERERRLTTAMLRAAQRLYACSRYVADQFPGLPMTVVHTGTHLVDSALPPATPPLSGTDVPTVVCVGRINRWKGQDVLVHALAALTEEGVPVRGRLVGGAFPGSEHLVDELRELVDQLGLTDSVTLEGEVDDPVAVFSAADVVVVPSKLPEPFGKVVVEAMALGRPVVATTPGGPAEVISSGVDGILVPGDDVAALTDALRDLLQHPAEAQRLGRAAAIRAGAFSEAATARRIADDVPVAQPAP